jgi:hypothetical protein
MGVPTHVMEYSGDTVATLGAGAGPLQFQGPLRALDGSDNWCLVLYALPPGKDYPDIAGTATLEYIQAAGRADRMAVEIRKPGGQQWGVEWVRYVIGHPHEGNPPIDQAIELPQSTQMISRAEAFDAEEAARLFICYFKTGDIPADYVLRPEEGYTTDGKFVDLRSSTA